MLCRRANKKNNPHRFTDGGIFCPKYSGRVRETKRFPDWNPQAEFISAEENWAFQGLPPERISLFFCFIKLKS
jgi:hypothetical protein